MSNTSRILARSASSAGVKRSSLLRLIMPRLSGDAGESLADALASGDVDTFSKIWADVTQNVLTQVGESKQ